MAMRVVFDNNFLHKFDEADEATREALLLCVDLGHLEIFASYEMLREVMGLAITVPSPENEVRKAKLIRHAGHVLRLTRGKILNPLGNIQETELRGAFELEMEEQSRSQIAAFFEQTAGGHIPSRAEAIGKKALEERKQAKAFFDQMYDTIVKNAKPLTAARRKVATYENLAAERWKKTGRRAVIAACAKHAVADPETVANRVMAEPHKYPHLGAEERVFSVMLHRYFIEKAARERGDLYDLWQMIYLVDMDIFVTNEKKLPGWYEDVFGSTKRVLTAEEFLGTSWC